jgi:hypothetical protein
MDTGTHIKTSNVILFLVLLIPAILIRFVLPLHFPSTNIDEGFWTMSAQNSVLADDPLACQVPHIFLSPLHYLTIWSAFSLFGPSLAISRWISALFGMGVIAFTYLLGRRFFNRKVGAIAALLVAYNSLMILSSRWAMLEQEVIFYMLVACWFWFHPRRELHWISGLFLGAALSVKIYTLALFAPLLLDEFFSAEAIKIKPFISRLQKSHLFALGLSIILPVVLYSVFWHISPEGFTQAWLSHSIHRWAASHLFEFAYTFMTHSPDLVLLALAGFVLGVIKRRPAMVFLGSWPIFTFLLVSAQAFRPARYYFPIIPVLAILAALLLVELSRDFIRKPWRLRAVYSLIVLMCLFQIVRLAPYYREGRETTEPVIAAAEYIEVHTSPGEPVLAPFDFGPYVVRPIVPLRLFNLEHYQLSQNPDFKLSQPWTQYVMYLWARPGDGGPSDRWTENFLSSHYREVFRSGRVVVMELADAEQHPSRTLRIGD